MNKKLVVLALALCGATAGFADDACVPCEVIDKAKNWLQSLMSCDPNEITGPAGVGEKRYVKRGAWMDYTVYFENKPDATAAAQEIRVTLPKDPGLDWSTLELGEVAFGNNIDSWFARKASGENTYAPSGSDTQVKTVVTVTDETVEWHLRSWDPNTPDHFPANVADGFLPPNDPDTHCGEGHVRFRVKVKDAAAIGSKINASATIVFDANPPIPTDPAWWNTVGQARKIVVSNDGVESEIEVFEGEAFGELPDPGAPPENCVFDGWYTKPGGNGYRINAYSTVEAEIEAIYAHWIPYVAEMNGVKYTSLANAVKKCPYNASETNEIKILSDVEWEDRRTFELCELTDAELVEAKLKGRWVEYNPGSTNVFYKHNTYFFGAASPERTVVVRCRDDDWAFFTGQKVAVDLDGHWHTNTYVQVDCADVVIRDSSPEKTGAVELQVAADLSYGGLTLESGKLVAGAIERDRATVLVCDTAGRFDFLGGEIVAREGLAAVYVSNGCIRVGGSAVATNAGCNVVLDQGASLKLVAPLTGRIGITTGHDVAGAVIGWNAEGFAGVENFYCDTDPTLYGKTTEDGRIVWEKMLTIEYTVTFNSNGGSAVTAQTVTTGGTATKPADPTKDGFIFAGWCSDEALTTAYDFSAAVTSNLTLHAKWAAEAPGPKPEAIPTLFDSFAPGAINEKGATYNGFLGEETFGGMFTLVVKKPKKGSTAGAATLTKIDPASGKKVKTTGTVDVTTGLGADGLAGLVLNAQSVGGKLGDLIAQGAVDAAKAKDQDALTVMNVFNKQVYGLVFADAEGEEAYLTATFSTKGKVKVAGSYRGAKVSGSAAMSVGDAVCAVPFVWSKKGVTVTFVLWFDKATRTLVDVSGLDAGATLVGAGVAGGSATTYPFVLDETAVRASVSDAITETFLSLAIRFDGKKFDAGKAAKVSYKKGELTVDTSKGDNVTGLKLTYSKGVLKGSFTVYAVSPAGKLVKNKFTVAGVMIDGVGYAVGTNKKLKPIPLELVE